MSTTVRVMLNQSRIDAPGAPPPIIARGIESRLILIQELRLSW